jgi:hypothetical protein
MNPITLRGKLGGLYDKPLPKNINFIKYNYTLEELKSALESENIAMVVASLGGGNTCAVNKRLQTLRPLLNVSLHVLKLKSWESLKRNTPIFIWKVKLYHLFSGQIPLLEQQDSSLFRPTASFSSCVSFHGQFFPTHSTHNANEEGIDRIFLPFPPA